MSETEKKKYSTDISNKRIKAISLYSPKVIQPGTADMKDLVTIIVGRSNLNEGTIFSVLKELGAVIPYFSSRATPSRSSHWEPLPCASPWTDRSASAICRTRI